MKLLNKFLIPFAALSLAACSSLDVDDSEAFTENFPEDFDGAVYMELHPQLVSLQVRNYIVNYNADAKDADSLITAEAVVADSLEFIADTAQLHKIYASPYYGGYGEERWQEAMEPTMNLKCKMQDRYTMVNLNQISGEDTTHIKLLDPITFVKDSTDTSKVVSVVGRADSAATEVDTLVLSDTLVLLSGSRHGLVRHYVLAGCRQCPAIEVPGGLQFRQHHERLGNDKGHSDRYLRDKPALCCLWRTQWLGLPQVQGFRKGESCDFGGISCDETLLCRCFRRCP